MSQQTRSIHQLLEQLDLTPEQVGFSSQAAAEFPLQLSSSFMARIKPGDANDPLLQQILPHQAEQNKVTGFGADPVAESNFSPVPGLLHKYPGRVLLIVTGACAINCRYCFRRHFPYEQQQPSLQQAFEWLQQHPAIEEVILSGGDPLTLSLRRLTKIHQQLAAIPHVKRLRIHSRQPIVSPECITTELVALLSNPRFKTLLVVHCNHPNELNDEIKSAATQLTGNGVTVLNQSVLLKDVNDQLDTLKQLSERLFDCGILPYYLHQLDRVSGAAHFAVSDKRALTLHHALRNCLSGYLVPKLVVELPGHQAKTPLAICGDRDDK